MIFRLLRLMVCSQYSWLYKQKNPPKPQTKTNLIKPQINPTIIPQQIQLENTDEKYQNLIKWHQKKTVKQNKPFNPKVIANKVKMEKQTQKVRQNKNEMERKQVQHKKQEIQSLKIPWRKNKKNRSSYIFKANKPSISNQSIGIESQDIIKETPSNQSKELNGQLVQKQQQLQNLEQKKAKDNQNKDKQNLLLLDLLQIERSEQALRYFKKNNLSYCAVSLEVREKIFTKLLLQKNWKDVLQILQFISFNKLSKSVVKNSIEYIIEEGRNRQNIKLKLKLLDNLIDRWPKQIIHQYTYWQVKDVFGQCGHNYLFSKLTTLFISKSKFSNKELISIFQNVYYGKNECQLQFLNSVQYIFSTNQGNKSKDQLIQLLSLSISLYTLRHHRPAFIVTEYLNQFYRKSFLKNNQALLILCLIIAKQNNYHEYQNHYLTQKNQKNSYYCKYLLYKSKAQIPKDHVFRKTINSTLQKILLYIMDRDYDQAYKLYYIKILKPSAMKKASKVLEYVMKKEYNFPREISSPPQEKAFKFIKETLQNQFIEKYITRSQDLGIMYAPMLPENRHDFWEQTQNARRKQRLLKLQSQGLLAKMRSRQFDIDKYLQEEYPFDKYYSDIAYESEKQRIKYKYLIKGTIEKAKIEGNIEIQKEIYQAQKILSEDNLNLIEQFGLKDYDILQKGLEDFINKFENMIQCNYIVRKNNADNLQINSQRMFSQEYLYNIILKNRYKILQAQMVIKLNPLETVNELISWGLITHNPMAIYMGEKLAMQTGQIIPHQLAQPVSNMLSYRYHHPPEFIEECKECLKRIGAINRQYIYQFQRDYHHIFRRKDFIHFLGNRKPIDLRFDTLMHLPQQVLFCNQPFKYRQSASKGPLI